jgi:hypothetical protein
VRAIGWKAHAALMRSAGCAAPLPGFTGAGYRVAGGELIWIGVCDTPWHPRAVVLDAAADAAGRLDVEALVPWRLPQRAPDRDQAAALREGSAALVRELAAIGPPRGFAALLAGEPAAFPLDRALPQVYAFAAAVDRDDAQAAYAAALPLLGLGAGLTPSGDDFVGAALLARRSLGRDAGWARAAQRLIDAAATRTHPLGAALFRDLAEGESFVALHRLAAVLAAREAPLAAARELTAIGHSSGFDMLAGLVVGAAGSAGFATCGRPR